MDVEEPHIDPRNCGDNAASYVLGALTAREHDAFRLHLESCAVCREEVAALQVVASALPSAAPQVSAPPALKERVMASVREDAARATAGELDGPARARPARSRRSLLPLRWGPALASGGALAALAAVLVIVLSGGGGASTRVIQAQAPTGADVSLHVSDGHAQLDISGMPQTPPQHVYEVWVKRTAGAEPTDALFTVTAKGDATVGVPGSVAGVKLVLVTSEPLGGTKVPTSSPVIVADLS